VVGEDVLSVFLRPARSFGFGGILQPGLEPGECRVERQLLRSTRIAMSERQISASPGPQANEMPTKRAAIDRDWSFSVSDRSERCSFELGKLSLELPFHQGSSRRPRNYWS